MINDILTDLTKEALFNGCRAKYHFDKGLLVDFAVGCSSGRFYASDEDKTAEYWVSTRKPLDVSLCTFKMIVDNDDLGEENRNRYAKEHGVYDYHLAFFPKAWMADIWPDFFKETAQADDSEVAPIDDVEETPVHRHINYGDGYSGTVYKFTGDVSYDEFIKFLEKKNVKIGKLEGYDWYQDHDLITTKPIVSDQRISWGHKAAKPGDKSKTWTHLHVHVYTD